MMRGRQVRRADISLAEVVSNPFYRSEQARGESIPKMKSWVVGKLSGSRDLLGGLVNSILVQYY